MSAETMLRFKMKNMTADSHDAPQNDPYAYWCPQCWRFVLDCTHLPDVGKLIQGVQAGHGSVGPADLIPAARKELRQQTNDRVFVIHNQKAGRLNHGGILVIIEVRVIAARRWSAGAPPNPPDLDSPAHRPTIERSPTFSEGRLDHRDEAASFAGLSARPSLCRRLLYAAAWPGPLRSRGSIPGSNPDQAGVAAKTFLSLHTKRRNL